MRAARKLYYSVAGCRIRRVPTIRPQRQALSTRVAVAMDFSSETNKRVRMSLVSNRVGKTNMFY